MRLFLLPICFLFFINCQESEIRRPSNKNKKLFLKESAIRNKNRFEIEQELFKKFAKNSTLEFNISEFGFWYAYKTKREINGAIPKKGDQVTFSYKIEDLNNNLIYSKKELGEVSFFIDEEDLIPALRRGIKIMKENEVVVFLFPSYLCFGYQGDGEKIGMNQPLKFTINLLKLKQKKT
tara:strand:- start:3 stop:539 length:537 start_codon:yes stop_codon:yes gene_type:complete